MAPRSPGSACDPEWIVPTVEACERLATLDVAAIGQRGVVQHIEQEARRVFGLQSARIVAGTLPGDSDDLVVVLPGVHLVGCGIRRPEWDAQARLFGSIASLVIEKQRAMQATRDQASEIDSLYLSVGQLTAKVNLEAVFQAIVERARQLLESDLSYIMLLDAEAKRLRLRAVTGNRTQAFLNLNRPVRPGTSAHQGIPLQSTDFLNDASLDHDADADRLLRLEGVKNLLGVPLRTDFVVLGTLYVARRHTDQYSEAQVHVLSSLAEHAALALDNARLYEEAVSAAADATDAKAQLEAPLRRLRRVHDLNHRLTEVLLAGEGVRGVAEVLADSFTTWVTITDWRHRTIATTAPAERGHPPSAAFLRRRDVQDALRRCGASYEPVNVGRSHVVAPIAAQRELLGYLWAACPDTSDEVETLRTSIQQASRVVALELLRAREAREAEHRLRRDFMYELLAERPPALPVLEARARQAWPGFAGAHRPLVLSLDPIGSVGGTPMERARRIVIERRSSDYVTVHGDILVVLRGDASTDILRSDAEALEDLLAKNALRSSIAIGHRCMNLVDTRRSILIARRLLELLGPRRVFRVEGMEALTTLFESAAPDRLQSFVEQTLAPLGNNPVLMETLLAYYEAGGNRTAAARQLAVHINTLRQRLERIERLLGGGLDDSARAVPLRLALLVRTSRPRSPSS